MSGAGAPTIDLVGLNPDGAATKIVVIASLWHEQIMDGLIAGAERVLSQAGVTHTTVRAAGCFELPLLAQAALRGGADAVVALGVILRGGTPHFEYVCEATTQGILRVGLDESAPIGFGVLTIDTEQQGLERAGLAGSVEDKGAESSIAALQALYLARQLRAS